MTPPTVTEVAVPAAITASVLPMAMMKRSFFFIWLAAVSRDLTGLPRHKPPFRRQEARYCFANPHCNGEPSRETRLRPKVVERLVD